MVGRSGLRHSAGNLAGLGLVPVSFLDPVYCYSGFDIILGTTGVRSTES